MRKVGLVDDFASRRAGIEVATDGREGVGWFLMNLEPRWTRQKHRKDPGGSPKRNEVQGCGAPLRGIWRRPDSRWRRRGSRTNTELTALEVISSPKNTGRTPVEAQEGTRFEGAGLRSGGSGVEHRQFEPSRSPPRHRRPPSIALRRPGIDPIDAHRGCQTTPSDVPPYLV